MKEESVLNVLMYLFKNHMQDNWELDTGQPTLVLHLEELGFRRRVINQAFSWLNNLARITESTLQKPHQGSLRVFSDFECEWLSMDCRRLLITLEQQGILNSHTRELVINQALELDTEEVDVPLIKWVVLMVLFNQPNEKHALTCMELLVLDNASGGIH